jgi:hypothetical protein
MVIDVSLSLYFDEDVDDDDDVRFCGDLRFLTTTLSLSAAAAATTSSSSSSVAFLLSRLSRQKAASHATSSALTVLIYSPSSLLARRSFKFSRCRTEKMTPPLPPTSQQSGQSATSRRVNWM